MASNLLMISNVSVYSEDTEDMKDQLCTLLITFSNNGDPTKQITTTHTFVSKNPLHYPQQRTVGWSDVKEKEEGEDVDQTYRPRVTALFRAAQTPLGEVGEDMIEQEKRTYYHLNQPSSKHYAFTANQQRPVKELTVTYESNLPKGLPRTDPSTFKKVEESIEVVDQYNKLNARTAPPIPSLNSSKLSIPTKVAEKARLWNQRSEAEQQTTLPKAQALSKSTEVLLTTGSMGRDNKDMLPSYRHQARSYESIHKSFERNNQHTEISYKREINEFKTEANDRPPEPRRLPRGFNLYTRYDDSTRSPRSVDKPESRRRAYGKGGQYIREEVHTEEHYVITRTPTSKQGDDARIPEQQKQELKIEIEKPKDDGATKQMRLIDYNQYENEVRRIKEQALKSSKPVQPKIDMLPMIPLTPAIVLPANRKEEPVVKVHKPRGDKDLTRYYSRTTERRDHTSRSPASGASPTPMNTSVQTTRSFLPENDEQKRIRELATESFREKIDILKTSKRFRPSGSPHSDSSMAGGTPSPRHFSPSATRRADSSQHSDTFSSPAPHTITSFPVTPLPDYIRESPPLSSSTPSPANKSSGVRGVLTKEVIHEFITDIVEERNVQKTDDGNRTTVFPIHEVAIPVTDAKNLSSIKEEHFADKEEVVKSKEEERKYQEYLKQKLSYEEQMELEIQVRRRRGDNDEMQPELLPVEETSRIHGEHRLSDGQSFQHEENTVTVAKRVYIDTIRDAYLGPLHLLGRQNDLNYTEFEPRRSSRSTEARNVAIQRDRPEKEEDTNQFDGRIETEIRHRMAKVGDRAPHYEPRQFEAEKTITERSIHINTKTSTDELLKPSDYTYEAQVTPLPRMEARAEYRSNISSRANFSRPQRTMSPIGSQGFSNTGGNRVLKILTESSSVGSGFSPYGGSSAATTIRDTREREKKEMSDLNDRLASYIEKVRFLEAQNRKLATDLAYLQTRWGQDSTSVRDMFEGDLKQAKRVLDEMERLRRNLMDECRTLQDDINNYRRGYDDAVRLRELSKDQVDELLIKLSALEGELSLLKRRIANLEIDVAAIKRENQNLISSLQRARNDLDQETLNRIDYQNQAQTLIEEIEFLRRAHDSEIRDLQAMASRDTTSENREYFKNELAAAIREIRAEYDQLTNANRTDVESWYKLKVQEIQTQSARHSMEQTYAADEVKRLRSQLSELRGKLADLEGRNAILEKNLEELNFQLEDDQRNYESALNDRDVQIRKIRDECQMLMVELQMLLDTKQTLDAEIAIYRKMLEGEEDRAGLRQLVEQVVRTHHHRRGDESESIRVIRGETSSRHSYQRSAKGNVSIHETSPDGRYIILENTHRAREEHIGEWKLKRRIDNRHDIVYTFPRDFVLGPGKTVRIWARNQGIMSPPDQLVFNESDSFGIGSNVQTILYNTQGEERATLVQRTSSQV